MSRTLRTPGLPPTHGPVGYRWQNTGSFCSLINTRATSCRTSPVGVGASVLPQWRRGDRPEASGGNMQSASDTPSSHSRRGWRSPRRREAATAWRSRPRRGAQRPGATGSEWVRECSPCTASTAQMRRLPSPPWWNPGACEGPAATVPPRGKAWARRGQPSLSADTAPGRIEPWKPIPCGHSRKLSEGHVYPSPGHPGAAFRAPGFG